MIENNLLPYRVRQLRRDITLYLNSGYAGFQKFETIEDYFAEYKELAEEKADEFSADYVILYAVFEYDIPEQTFVSANFMLLEIPYDVYMEFVHKLLDRTRFFFIRGRKDYDVE